MASSASAATALPELYIQELWRAGRELRPVTEAVGVPGDAMFTEKEVRGLLQLAGGAEKGSFNSVRLALISFPPFSAV